MTVNATSTLVFIPEPVPFSIKSVIEPVLDKALKSLGEIPVNNVWIIDHILSSFFAASALIVLHE